MSSTRKSAKQPSRFKSVADLLKATTSKDTTKAFEALIFDSRIVNRLIRTRAEAGMTQSELAAKMGCTQGAISKLEHSSDGDLTMDEIASYLQATGGRLNIGFGPQAKITERIKDLASCLKHELETLADQSSNSDDVSIRQGINKFFGEAWFNLFNILCDATSKLPHEPEQSPYPLRLLSAKDLGSPHRDEANLATC